MQQTKKALIIGLGSSGDVSARFLISRGWSVRAIDTREKPARAQQLLNDFPEVEFQGGHLSVDSLDGVSLVVISPGLSPEYSEAAPIVKKARSLGIDVVGEIELFARELKRLRQFRGYRPQIIGITGTNGKTTTTMLSYHIVKESGKSVCVAGNVGPNALWELDKLLKANKLPEVWVLELSSFQLETTDSLVCDAAAILNVTEDHLDWHGGMENYVKAKAKIFSPSTVRVLNRDDATSLSFEKGVPAEQVLTFGVQAPARINEFGISDQGSMKWLSCWTKSTGPTLLLPQNALRIRGLHNAMNALAASALVSAIGVPMDPLLRALRDYRGEAHRVQSVLISSDIEYIDDSKGTNVGATEAALKGFGASQVVIILGGDGKGQEFKPLKDALKEHAAAVVLIGKDADKIEAEALPEDLPRVRAQNMQQAVRSARSFAKAGQVILLSPACASWDMFKDYADRSAQFIEAAREIAQEEGQPC